MPSSEHLSPSQDPKTIKIPPLEGKRVALVHDWLNGMRGGEKVLEVFCELFPEADLFTLIHEPGKVSPTIEKHRIYTSFLQRMPKAFRYYRYYLPLFPRAIESFDLSGYDFILSSSHCVAKGIPYANEQTYHLSYVHAPMRYIWDQFPVYFGKGKASPLVRLLARLIRKRLQRWDIKSNHRVHAFIGNSRNVRSQIKRIYNRDAEVIWPPVDLDFFSPGGQREGFYLMVGAFAPNKRVDLAIEVFNELKLPLKIVGGGQNEERLRAMAKDNIEFLGQADNQTVAELYRSAKAFIFPGEDDFGITPLEAQASGTPVIAYARGGALETVSGQTGLFFNEPTPESLAQAVRELERNYADFEPQRCVSQARRFGRKRFKQEIANLITDLYSQWQEHQQVRTVLNKKR